MNSQRKNKTVVITSGVIEAKVADQVAIMALANLPSRETLLTQLAGWSINASKRNSYWIKYAIRN